MCKPIFKFDEVIEMKIITKKEFLSLDNIQKARTLRLIAEGIVKIIG